MRESYFQGQLCGQNAVKDSEKKILEDVERLYIFKS